MNVKRIPTHENALKIAEERIVKELVHRAPQSSTHAPRFHVMPPCGWMNDPNGLVQFRGLYHAFYQFHPFSTEWGPMHWGHAMSSDMVSWQPLRTALAPSESYDRDGCFSGSAIVHDDKLYIMYTGHVWRAGYRNDSDIEEVQCLAVSDDGVNFKKLGVVIEPPAGIMHFRDPKIWRGSDRFWCVVGAKLESEGEKIPQILLYWSEDLKKWYFDRVMASGTAADGYMWECPDFFELDGEAVLITSPQGMESTIFTNQNLFQSGITRGSWKEGKAFHVLKPFKELDIGPDFYAPQTFQADDGRRIMMAWANMWETAQPSDVYGFAGSLTLPRVLQIVGDKLIQKPVEELKKLRYEELRLHPITICTSETQISPDMPAFEFVMEIDLEKTTATSFGFDPVYGIRFRFERTDRPDELIAQVVRDYSDRGLFDLRNFTIKTGKRLRVHGFFDHGIVEIFFDDYEKVYTARAFPAVGRREIAIFAHKGNLSVSDGCVWRLKK